MAPLLDPTAPLRVLVVEPDDGRYEALAAALAAGDAVAVKVEWARTPDDALGALRAGRADVCIAPSGPGPDVAAGLTLRLARAGAFVPVVAVVETAADGLEAIRDEGAADFVLRSRLDAGDGPHAVARALLVARARREAVEAFRHAQDVLAATLRAADLPVVELDEAGLVVRASAGVGPVLGRDPRDLVGRLYDAAFEEAAAAAIGVLLGAASPGAPLQFRQWGEPAVDWAVSPLPAGGAVAVGSLAPRRDEDAEARTVLQHVADTLPLVVLSTDAKGRVRYLGGAALEAFGITAEDLQGESVFVLLGARSEAAAYARRALVGEPNEALLTRGGRLFRTRFLPLLDEPGRPDGLVMVAYDVTEREEAERARRQLAHALDAVADAIGVSDVSGTALYVNRAMEALLGYSLEAMNAAGGPPALYADPETAGAVFDAIRAGERWEGEVTLVARAGHAVRLHLTAAAVYDSAGDLVGLVGVHRPSGGG
jgi:PAS domain S-box-containing protein